MTLRRPLLSVILLCLSLALSGLVPALAQTAAPNTAELPRPRPLDWGATAAQQKANPLPGLVRKAAAGGTSAIALLDLQTGELVEEWNGGQSLPPASVLKIVTALYGIDQLGENHRFTTRVIATGPVEAGAVNGDLILVGGGDPALDTDELAEMVKTLKAKGVTRITGRFLYYDAAVARLREIDDGQPANAGYNPGLSGLNLNFNRVFFEWKPEGGDINLSLQARAESHSPRVSAMRIFAEDRSSPLFHYSEKGGSDHWTVARKALKKPGGVWLPVRDSGAYAADVFRTLAAHYGIRLPKPTRTAGLPPGRELARFERRELRLVARGMLHYSTNVTAELIGLAATARQQSSRTLDTSAEAMEYWAEARYGIATPVFRDHSGLGDDSTISALDMARLVSAAGAEGELDGLLRSYSVPRPGSRKALVPGAEVRAKTGTLNFVRGLSGIIKGANGRRFAFAILTADLEARARADSTLSYPPGTKRFWSRAKSLERAVLAHWLTTYGR